MTPGARYEVIPDLDSMVPDLVQVESQVNHPSTSEAFPGVAVSDAFATRWTGCISIGSGGNYIFSLSSNDGISCTWTTTGCLAKSLLHRLQCHWKLLARFMWSKGPDSTPQRFARNRINGPKIVSGQDATECEWGLRAASGFHFCGGTLISSKWVMSAAHCIEGNLTYNSTGEAIPATARHLLVFTSMHGAVRLCSIFSCAYFPRLYRHGSLSGRAGRQNCVWSQLQGPSFGRRWSLQHLDCPTGQLCLPGQLLLRFSPSCHLG